VWAAFNPNLLPALQPASSMGRMDQTDRQPQPMPTSDPMGATSDPMAGM